MPSDPILDPLARIEDSARELAALMPESRVPASILASVAALRRRALPRKPLPAGWGWRIIDDGGTAGLSRGEGRNIEIASVAGNHWCVFESETSAAKFSKGYGVDHEDARLAAEDYLHEHGWPT